MTTRCHEVVVCHDVNDVGRTAADLVGRAVTALGSSRRPVLGVATGSTPSATYAELGIRVRRGELALDHVELVALDEYLGLPTGDARSYRATLERDLVAPLGLRSDRLHVPEGTAADPDAAAAAYEEELAGLGGVDLQLLGIGANGHVAFNEPGSLATTRTRVVELAERTRADNARFFDHPSDVPRYAITQGVGTLLEAWRLVLLATGASKAAALAAALHGPVGPETPASWLRSHRALTVVADRAAAALLPG